MNKLLIILIFLFAEAGISPAYAQSLQLSFDDSIVCSGKSMFATNIVKFVNVSKDSMPVKISVLIPKNWQFIGSKNKEFILAPKEILRIPLSFKKTAASSANWEKTALHINTNLLDTSVTFLIKALPVYKCSIALTRDQLFVTNAANPVAISVVIKNTGNIQDVYKLNFENEFLNLHKNVSVELKAGEADTITQKINISKTVFNALKNEKVYIQLKNVHDVFQLATCEVFKSSNSIKDRASAYDLVNAETETGVLVNGKRTAFYSAVGGQAKFGEAKFNFNYRTKQFGVNNNLYSNIFNINYNSKKLLLHVGRIIDNRFYYSTGNGMSVTYANRNKEWFFAGIIADKKLFLSSSSMNAGLKQNFKNWNVASDFAWGKQFGQSSVLQYHLLSYTGLKNVQVQIGAGSGKFFNNKALAFAGQYKISFENKRWSIESKMVRSDRLFPGIQRGLKDDRQNIRLKFKNFSASIFYTRNKTFINYFRDTVYNSDALSINNERMGMSLQLMSSKGSFGVSSGEMSSSFLAAGAGSYRFVEGNLSKSLFKFILISGNASYGKNKSLLFNNKKVYFTNAYFRIASRWGGFNFSAMDLPQVDYITKAPTGILSTRNAGPFVQVNLFKKLSLYVNYQISKTAIDNGKTRMLISNINYTDPKHRISFSFSGMIPLVKSNVNTLGFNQTYMSFTFNKQFSLPLFFRQKYPTLKMVVFDDKNSDAKRQKEEKAIDSVKIVVDGAHFQSKQGVASYKNLAKKNYSIEIFDLPRGYAPMLGKIMNIDLKKNTTVFIPIVKSKIISGHVQVEDDSLSTTRFAAAGVKVTATDSTGNQYSSICNEKGEYFISVPANKYTVSLNPDAFDNAFKPVQMQYAIDVVSKNEKVNFYIKQAKRKVRLLNQKN